MYVTIVCDLFVQFPLRPIFVFEISLRLAYLSVYPYRLAVHLAYIGPYASNE